MKQKEWFPKYFGLMRKGVEVIKRDKCCNKSPRNECLINGIKGILLPWPPPTTLSHNHPLHTASPLTRLRRCCATHRNPDPTRTQWCEHFEWITLAETYGFNWNKPLKQPVTPLFAWLRCFMKAGLQYHGWFNFKEFNSYSYSYLICFF